MKSESPAERLQLPVEAPKPVPDDTGPIPFSTAAGPERPPRRRWPWVVGLIAAGIVLAVVLSRSRDPESKGDGKSKGKPAAAREVPVVAVPARAGDMPVFENGLGNVAPVATVVVRSRVDGQLVNVAYREGQLVKKGDLLAELDARPFQVQLMQAEGQLAKDQAALRNARLDLKRYEDLAAQGIVPQQQRDTQLGAVGQIEGTIRSDEAQVASARLNISYARITAPITGRAGLRQVDTGNMVHANDQGGLVVLTQLEPITVVFSIPADQLPPVLQQLRAGTKLPVEAYDRDMKSRLASGTLLAADNQIDSTTGTVRLKSLFENRDAALFPNQFVNARLLVSTLPNVVLIPTSALQRSPQATFVWVVKPDSTAEMRNVEVRRTEGDTTAVAKGVAAGELVVTDGVDKIQQGVKVKMSAKEAPAGGGGAGHGAGGGTKRGASKKPS